MMDFTGKNVLVTGGSRGIGAATVRLFAKLGANVSFNYHQNKDAASRLLSEIQLFHHDYMMVQCDIANPVNIQEFVLQTTDKFKSIDVLVNNAGIWEYAAIDTMSEQEWRKTMQINLDSIFHFTKLVVLTMKNLKTAGRIINIASTAGQRGEAYHSHYAASKGAIISFTKSLASELGPHGILVNCVAPGWVDTDMSHDAIVEYGQDITNLIPLKTIPGADEIAGPIVFLASDMASAITGEILNVNSGSVLCG